MTAAELARYEKGLSRDDVASETGLSVRTIGRIEAGTVKPSAANAKLLADLYGVSDAELLGVERSAA